MTDKIKLNLKSMSISEEKKVLLRQLFPEVFTEDKVDFERLKQVLGESAEAGIERYGMNWAGKKNCFKIIQEPSTGTLKPCRDESVKFDTTENVFIEGDNLEVLKLLQKSYYGKVKMIYIDPPYNTGNEFIYPDNFSESLDTYLKYTGQKDAEGKKFSTNVETDGRFHSKWMNMMYTRLYLSRNLLMKEGVIFISIDDHEEANLRKICDEIFGEQNFIATISRLMKSGGAKGNFFTPNIDSVIIYAKDITTTPFFRAEFSKEQIDRYYNKTETDGPRKGEIYGEERIFKASLDPRPNQRYWIKCPDGSFAIPPGKNFPKKIVEGEKITPTAEDGVWKWIYERYQAEYAKGNIVFKKTTESALVDESGNPAPWNLYNKMWLKDQEEKGVVPSNFIGNFENRQSSAELKSLGIPFDFAKPVNLIKYLIQIAASEKDAIVLDYFAGSATTAHAVYELNKKDGGNRKYIVVQLPEPCQEDSEAFKAGYKNIADIGKERIRKVIAKFSEESGEVNIDLGFKVFKLSQSNFKTWETEHSQNVAESLRLFADHIDPNANPEDILYEILLKSRLELTAKVEKVKINEKDVFSVEDGTVYIYLGDSITKELTYSIAERNPIRFVCLDHSFHRNDQLKTNTVQLMKSRNIEFRTV